MSLIPGEPLPQEAVLIMPNGKAMQIKAGDRIQVKAHHDTGTGEYSISAEVVREDVNAVDAEEALADDRNDHIRKIVERNSELRADNERLRTLLATERKAIDELEAAVATWRKRLTAEEEENAALRHRYDCLSKHHAECFSVIEKAGGLHTSTLCHAIMELVKERDEHRAKQDVTESQRQTWEAHGRAWKAKAEEAAKLSHQYRNERDTLKLQRDSLLGQAQQEERPVFPPDAEQALDLRQAQAQLAAARERVSEIERLAQGILKVVGKVVQRPAARENPLLCAHRFEETSSGTMRCVDCGASE